MCRVYVACVCATDRVLYGRHVDDLPSSRTRWTYAANPLGPLPFAGGHDGSASGPLSGSTSAYFPPSSTTTGAPPAATSDAMQGAGTGSPAVTGTPLSVSFSVSATAYGRDGTAASAAPVATVVSGGPVATSPSGHGGTAVQPQQQTPYPARNPLDAALQQSHTASFLRPWAGLAPQPPPGTSQYVRSGGNGGGGRQFSVVGDGGAAEEAAAYASLIGELCDEVGVTWVDELLPRVRQLCEAALMLPVLDGFAATVCDKLGRFVQGNRSSRGGSHDALARTAGAAVRPPGLTEASAMLSGLLKEVQSLRKLNAIRRRLG